VAKLNLELKIKSRFNGKKIEQKIGKARFKWLNDVAGATRKFAIRSMKPARKTALKNATKRERLYGRRVSYRTGRRAAEGKSYFQKGRYSAPGSPPYVRSPGKLNLREIYYYIRSRDEVRVGPHWLAGSKMMSRPVPNIHETGGKASRKYRSRHNANSAKISRKNRGMSRSKAMRFPKRPFMNPAGMKAAVWLRNKMRNSIK